MKKLFTLALVFVAITNTNAQLSSGMIAWWPFNGNAIDSTLNGHNGTSNNITYATGRNGATNAAAVFNGTSSFITTPYTSKLNISKYSICAIVKLNGFYTGQCHGNNILSRGTQHTQGAYGMQFIDTVNNNCSVAADTNVYTLIAEAGPNNTNIPGAAWHYPYFLHTGQWYSFIATYDSLKIRIYINGVIVDSATSTAPIVPIGNSTDSIFIGANYNGTTGAFPYWFKGLMDDLRIYNRVLSSTEITQYHHLSVTNTEKQLSDVTIFPNPNKGSFIINGMVRGSTKVGIEVINTLGQIVYYDSTITHNGMLEKSIILPDAVTGIYYLKLNTETDSKIIKLLIQ